MIVKLVSVLVGAVLLSVAMPMGLFNRGKKDHKPDDVAVMMDVTGTCRKCRHHTTAQLKAYWSGEILIRCSHCRSENTFEVDSESWTDAKRFIPFRTDEDDQK